MNAWRWFAAGLLFGVSLYTYTPIRVLIFIMPLWMAVILIHGSARRMWPGVLFAGFGFAAVALPLIVYGITHSEVLFGRAAGVLAINMDEGFLAAARMLAFQVWKVIAMFGGPGLGDTNLRHNVPGRPALDWWIAAAAVFGLLMLTRQRRQLAVLFLCLLGLSMIPTMLSEEAPHFARGSGAMLVVFPMAAFGIAESQRQLVWVFHTLKQLAMAGGRWRLVG